MAEKSLEEMSAEELEREEARLNEEYTATLEQEIALLKQMSDEESAEELEEEYEALLQHQTALLQHQTALHTARALEAEADTKRLYLERTGLEERFYGLIEELSEDFDEAATMMLRAMLQFASGESTKDDCLAAIAEVGDALREASRHWVEQVLPEVYAAGVRQALDSPQTSQRHPMALAGDVHDEALALSIEDVTVALAGAASRVRVAASSELRDIAIRRLGASLDAATDEAEDAREIAQELEWRVEWAAKSLTVLREPGSADTLDPRSYVRDLLRDQLRAVVERARESTTLEIGPAKLGAL